MQDYFYQLADVITSLLRGNEVCTCSFSGEDSDFVRFNYSAVRQAGSISQRELTLDLIEGRRHASGRLSLSGGAAQDRARLVRLVQTLRENRYLLPEDPFLHYATSGTSTEVRGRNDLPDCASAVAAIQRAGAGRDLVGFYAAGGTHAGFANSFGQRNWHSRYSYNFDWSFYLGADKAAKGRYAGFSWQAREFERKVEAVVEQLDALRRRPRAVSPGRYRIYLAPAALYEMLGLLGQGGFALRAHRTKTTPLLKMIADGARLSPALTILENTRDGVAPGFQEAGFLRPEQVTLLQEGRYNDCLVSPRSALEYGVATNGACEGEVPLSLEVCAGMMATDDVLRALGTGLYVSDLWYLNFSDRNSCRITGMTRFATFWVEGGAIKAPLEVMRFDETIYRMLGENLIDLTLERELILDPGTYSCRSVASARLPGALVNDFAFTL